MTVNNFLNEINQELTTELEVSNFDANNESTGGGDRVVLEPGTYPGYLVEYVDLGDQVHNGYQGAPDTVHPSVHLGVVLFNFDAEGKYETVVLGSGARFPLKVSLHEKSKFRRIFKRFNFNDDPSIKHFAQLLGAHHSFEFKVTKDKSKDGKREYNKVDLESATPCWEGSFNARKRAVLPEVDQDEYAVFLWNNPSATQWDSIRRGVEGTSPAASSNYFQHAIINAKNFKGSAVQVMLEENQVDYTTVPQEATEKGAAGAALPNQEISEDVPEQHEEGAKGPGKFVTPSAMPTMPEGV